MSFTVTLQDSNDRDLKKFFSVFKCCSPELVIPEFETFKEIKLFCDKFKHVRDERSLIFFTPSSVNPPPHISSNLRFLKPNTDDRKWNKD
ncbi:hypothetical protein CR513_51483, partial [Mucuna pruriens]